MTRRELLGSVAAAILPARSNVYEWGNLPAMVSCPPGLTLDDMMECHRIFVESAHRVR